MRLLLDTHMAIWLAFGDEKLPARARSLIEQAASVHLSVVSLVEAAIKRSVSIGRPDRPRLSAPDIAREIEDAGLDLLPLKPEHALALEHLPFHHRDPFDRLIVVQALYEPMRLLTADPMLARYSDTVILV